MSRLMEKLSLFMKSLSSRGWLLIRKKYFWIILSITLFALFLRAYQHENLLFFEVDQARDWRIVEIAQQYGIGELPLLGPGMNASSFRIGPIYHYIQYLSAIFGNSPNAISYPDLIFSVLTIPLFYFFLKEFFSKRISAILSLLLACSLFAIEYGRFAMNSNSIPFFSLLIFYSLLRISREKEQSKRWLWIIILSFALGIIIQLHALTLVGIPIIIIAYLLATRTKIRWKECLAGFLILFVLTSPMFINEWMTSFQSVRSLFSGVSSRQNSQNNFSLSKRIIKSVQELDRNYVVMLFSREIVKSLDPVLKKEGAWDMIIRNIKLKRDRLNMLLSFLAFIFFAVPFMHLGKWYFVLEKDIQKRNFIALIFIWQIIFGILIAWVVFVQHSRYYLILMLVPFILLGIYFQIFFQNKKCGKILVAAVFSAFLIFNLFQVKKWFQMVGNYSNFEASSQTASEFILDPFYNVTWGQMKSIDAYLEKVYQENGKGIFLMSPDQFYSRSIRYPLIYEKNMPIQIFSNGIRDKDKMYFSIQPTDFQNNENNNQFFSGISRFNFQNDFEVIDSKNFGTLTLLSAKVKDSVPSEPVQIDMNIGPSSSDFKKDEPDNVHLVKRYSWNNFFLYLKNPKKSK